MMEFQILDTERSYRRLLDAPDSAARESIFRAELAEPFSGLGQRFGMSDPLTAFAQWGMTPEQATTDHGAWMRGALDALAAAKAWERAARALDTGWSAFSAYAGRIPTERITFGLLLADMSATPEAGGYTGFGAIPGWIMTVYDTPDAYNLERVEAATVHELHHNLAGAAPSAVNMNMITATVGDYMILEGLAESFAAELYGADKVGPWVSKFDMSRLDETRALFRAGLDRTGFGIVRSYIFGDEIAGRMGTEPVGAPLYAGYALGYQVVQAYLQRSGRSVIEATFEATAREIIAESGFFDGL